MDTTDEADLDAPTLALGDINADDATDISTDLGNDDDARIQTSKLDLLVF